MYLSRIRTGLWGLGRRCLTGDVPPKSNKPRESTKRENLPQVKEVKKTEECCSTKPSTGESNLCLYTAVPCPQVPCFPNPIDPESIPVETLPLTSPIEKTPIVIIGAGVAGLTAAKKLVTSGFSQTTVLESTSRPGGRIKSVVLGDSVVELGADPFSGHPSLFPSSVHPLVVHAASEGIVPPTAMGDHTFGLLTTPVGGPLALAPAFSAYLSVKEFFKEVESLKLDPTDDRANQFMGIKLNGMLSRLPPKEAEMALRAVAAIAGKPPLTRVLESDGVASYAVLPGGFRVPLGATSMIASLIQEIGAQRIHYNKKVIKIRWGTVTPDQKPRAVIKCADGSQFTADHVLVTLPPGVLQQEAQQIFVPQLSTEWHQAIANLKPILKEKLYVLWAKPIWSWRDCAPLNRMWKPEDMADREDWTKSLISVREHQNSQYILHGLIQGPGASDFNLASDQDVMRTFWCFVKEWLGDDRIPMPVAMIRSSWTRDSSYKASLTGPSSPETDKILTTSQPDNVFGESPILYFGGDTGSGGTLTGAILSGYREADNIINNIRQRVSSEIRDPCLQTCVIPTQPTASLCF